MMWFDVTSDLIPPSGEWQRLGQPQGAVTADEDVRVVSPPFTLKAGNLYGFELAGGTAGSGDVSFALKSLNGDAEAARTGIERTSRTVPAGDGTGFAFLPEADGPYRLELANGTGAVTVRTTGAVAGMDMEDTDTALSHWGPVRRAIHGLCKRHRAFNAFVAGMEMRFGREEVLSLPLYMALCPTGQCNALCGFCAVSANKFGDVTDTKRSGILKQRLVWDRLGNFLKPTINTVYLYGLEGNGEPTLYPEFDPLLGLLASRRSDVYLITNGSQIGPERLPVILSLQSITVSLNAASAETHRQVMKLKDWDLVCNTVRAVLKARGTLPNPVVYLSFVAHHDNIHELSDFLRFAEHDLKGDVVVIRPISELANELGVNEDLRALLPFESDVRDAIDAAGEYLHDTRRRIIPHRNIPCRIEIDPGAFAAVRPDPLDRVVMPKGFEDRILAPRRGDWTAQADEFAVRWHLDTAYVHAPAAPDLVSDADSGTVWRSAPTPVEPGCRLRFSCRARMDHGTAALAIVDDRDRVFGRVDLPTAEADGPRAVACDIDTGDATAVRFELIRTGGAFGGMIDFERLRTPGPALHRDFKLPHPDRWMVDSEDVETTWRDGRLRIKYAGPPKPDACKSFSTPCLPGREETISAVIEVRSGTLVVSVVGDDLSSTISESVFGPGRHDTLIQIETGTNRRVRLILGSGSEAPLDAEIDWGEALAETPVRAFPDLSAVPAAERTTSAPSGDEPPPWFTGLPATDRWQSFRPGVETMWKGAVLSLATDGPSGPYLYGCEDMACLLDDEIVLPARIRVRRGTLVVGMLSADKTAWVGEHRFARGEHVARLRFNVGDRAHLILYSGEDGPLEAEIDWSAAIAGGAPATAGAAEAPEGGAVETASRARRSRRYYCQKPWTDLNNFTVDGRMDVCCIATGSSQKRYALGNIMEQSFQEVWNGTTMRTFRRTVNGDDKLPPCQRCPMARSWQGPFFDRTYMAEQTRMWLASKRIGAGPRRVLLRTAMTVLDRVMFRGFKE